VAYLCKKQSYGEISGYILMKEALGKVGAMFKELEI